MAAEVYEASELNRRHRSTKAEMREFQAAIWDIAHRRIAELETR